MSRVNNKSIAKAIIQLITVIIVAAVIIFIAIYLRGGHEPKIDNTFVNNKLEAASELTSAKMTYNGLIHYSDGDIPLLTQKGFIMTYRAAIKVGIDLSKVESKVTLTKVEIIVPAVEVLDVKVDTESIQYYDEKAALFNWESKNDAIDAIKAAEDDVLANGDMETLKATAKDQIGVLLEGLFKDSIGDKRLVVTYQEQ